MTLLDSTPVSPPRISFSSQRIVELRALLNEKFPSHALEANRQTIASATASPLDDLVRGAVSEFVGSLGSGSLYLAALLRAASRMGMFAGFVDSGRSFDPQDWEVAVLERMLWILCEDAQQAIKAADLLLRDGNLPLLVLDLQTLAPRELARIPVSTWHRFHRVAAQSSVAMVVLSPRPLVEGARVRIAARARWTLAAMHRRRRALWEELDLKVFARGGAVQAALSEHLRTA